MTPTVPLAEVERAAERIRSLVVRTPLLESERLGAELGVRVLVKAENLQHTGSFKLRGALNTLLGWQEDGELPTGVATFSAGNHGAAVAHAARLAGIPAVVCMPPAAVASKVEAVRGRGAEVVFTDDLLGTCRALCEERGHRLLHPFDDPAVIAGQGTVGLEVLQDCPDVDLLVVPVGGGGLISGTAVVARAVKPGVRVAGVEPLTANGVSHGLRVGRPEPLPVRPVSLADGLAAPFAGEHTLAHVRELVDRVVEIDEQSIRDAWWPLVDATKLLVEPSAAVGLAALRSGALPLGDARVVVLVLSGGNTAATLG
ncbi:threonine ammonia-lyase [Umezawaea beigongshangensis]|uniref:threonine ammonia-lyase n=1 Tax=Umezawaea beigongshangensis TaxID=2780383 RepID=UPI0018F270C6|nr:threonine/serine dehydratase [Umezawaea beigongshangensis]